MSVNVAYMLQKCLFLLLTLQQINITNLKFDGFSENMFSAHFHELNCSSIHMDDLFLTLRDDAWAISSPLQDFFCTTKMDFFNYSGILHLNGSMQDADIFLSRQCSSNCVASMCVRENCQLNVSYLQMYVDPPSKMIDSALESMETYIKAKLQNYICGIAIDKLIDELKNSSVVPPKLPPDARPGSLPIHEMSLYKALNAITVNLPSILGMRVSIQNMSNTTVKFLVEAGEGVWLNMSGDVNEESSTLPPEDSLFLSRLVRYGGYLMRIMRNDPRSSTVENFLLPFLPASMSKVNFSTLLPAGAIFSVDVTLNELECSDDYICSVSGDRGIVFSNVRIDFGGDVGRIFTNHFGETLSQMLSELFAKYQVTLEESRFILPMRPKAASSSKPSLLLIILYPIVAGFVCFALVRHSMKPELLIVGGEADMESNKEIPYDDILLCVGVFLCLGGFLWSNFTTGASVVVGGELEVYTFSLLGTARDMWAAGLKPLAICVFVFSGLYPYVKLGAILLFTIILKRPDSTYLHILDMIGKFSLIDTYVMVIMVSGLSIPKIVDVRILPSFYIFVFSTVGSLLLGNFATLYWRKDAFHITEDAPNEERALFLGEDEDVVEMEDIGMLQKLVSYVKKLERQIWCLILFSVFLLVPCWIFYALKYRFGGLAPLITEEERSFNLFQLCLDSGFICFAVTFATVFVFPMLFPFFSTNGFVVSWYAADVFVVACIAGLLQLNQFVQFVLGGDANGFYNAHAALLWPLYLLCIHAVIFWFVNICALNHVNLPEVYNNFFKKMTSE